MKGYKIINSDWTCRGFKYKVGEIFEMNSKPICYASGFHSCFKLEDCYNYYNNINGDKHIVEVEILGETHSRANSISTNKIKIIRELSQEEIEEYLRLNRMSINWKKISSSQRLSESFMKEFKDKIDWNFISYNIKLSENFIRDLKDYINWYLLLMQQDLSEDFILEFKDKINAYKIYNSSLLSKSFKEEFFGKIG